MFPSLGRLRVGLFCVLFARCNRSLVLRTEENYTVRVGGVQVHEDVRCC